MQRRSNRQPARSSLRTVRTMTGRHPATVLHLAFAARSRVPLQQSPRLRRESSGDATATGDCPTLSMFPVAAALE